MSSSEAMILTGNLIGNETATIILAPRTCQADGIDIVTSVKALECEFKVETFFYGYNLETFIQQAQDVAFGKSSTALLINYDQTVMLEFIIKDAQMFLSFAYTSVLPQITDKRLFKTLVKASSLDSAANAGSRFSFSFMPLHNPLSEVAVWLNGVLASHKISTVSPYP